MAEEKLQLLLTTSGGTAEQVLGIIGLL